MLPNQIGFSYLYSYPLCLWLEPVLSVSLSSWMCQNTWGIKLQLGYGLCGFGSIARAAHVNSGRHAGLWLGGESAEHFFKCFSTFPNPLLRILCLALYPHFGIYRRMEIDTYFSLHKTQVQANKDLNLKPDTISLIEDKAGNSLENISTRKNFLNKTPRA